MNMFDFNNKIYGTKKLKQGDYADFIMESIEQQELLKIELNNYSNNDNNSSFNKINKEIKF